MLKQELLDRGDYKRRGCGRGVSDGLRDGVRRGAEGAVRVPEVAAGVGVGHLHGAAEEHERTAEEPKEESPRCAGQRF